MKRKRVYAVGEMLIDFVCSDVDADLAHGEHFMRKPGGAPANVCAVIGCLGGDASFIGKVGSDPFGTYLRTVLSDCGVDTTLCRVDEHHPTTLAFVSLTAEGERDFTFHRGADAYLSFAEIDQSVFSQQNILHCGSATGFLGGTLTDAYVKVLARAYETGMFISFDPNYRPDLWMGDTDRFVRAVYESLPYVTMVKFSEEELFIVTGTDSVRDGIASIHDAGVSFVAVTCGKSGSVFSTNEYVLEVPSITVTSVDSTGAGDAFVGALLFQLAGAGSIADTLADQEKTSKMITFANITAALVCTKYGAISSIPEVKDIEAYMKNM